MGKNRLSVKSKKVVGLRVREGLFFILFVHLTKEESQAIQPAKEEFAIGILWIQGSDLWIWHWNFYSISQFLHLEVS
jgi:hypothetical protein